jgi:hypothetical protein
MHNQRWLEFPSTAGTMEHHHRYFRRYNQNHADERKKEKKEKMEKMSVLDMDKPRFYCTGARRPFDTYILRVFDFFAFLSLPLSDPTTIRQNNAAVLLSGRGC